MMRGLLSLSGANLIYAIAQWIPVAIFARLGSADELALYTLALSVPAPLLMFAQMNLRNVLASDVRNTVPFAVYRNLRAVAVAASVVAVAIFSRNLVVTLGACVLGLEWVGDIYQGQFQRQNEPRRAAWSVLLRGLLPVATLCIVLAAGFGATAALLGNIVVRALVWLTVERGGAAAASADSRERQWMDVLRTAWPLGVVMMIGSVSSNMPRYFAEYHVGHAGLAAFAVVWALAALGNLLTNSVGQAFMSPLAKVAAEYDAAGFARLSMYMTGGGLLLGVVAVLCGQFLGTWVLGLLYGAAYEQYQPLLVAVLGAAGFGYAASLLGTAITAARRFREQVPVQIAAVVAGFLAGVLAIPSMGLPGLAVSIAASNLTQLVGEAIVLRSAIRAMEPKVEQLHA
ncbi:MAG: lipopolysaccharide biosynthesis protein [Acidobacteria bacterium]|nr:lipopolysaccharide biosynthesis protein [Acidobacteriota bacterium]